MRYDNPNMVMNKPEIFLNVKFGLTWMTDTEARKELKNHFLTEECVYPDIELMALKLQEYADHSRDYLNRLYELQMRNKEYNPVENYDRYEEWTDHSTQSSTSHSDSQGDTFQFPMNTTAKKQVGNQIDSMTGTSSGTGDGTHNGHIHGNIGVTTGAQMIQGEADVAQLIYKLKDEFCKQFDDLFMITI